MPSCTMASKKYYIKIAPLILIELKVAPLILYLIVQHNKLKIGEKIRVIFEDFLPNKK